MKRYGTSITALAVAGAMTLSIAPNASAQQSSINAELAGSSVNAVNGAIERAAGPLAEPIIDQLSSNAVISDGSAAQASASASASQQAVAVGHAQTGVTVLPAMAAWTAGGEAGQLGGVSWYYHKDGVSVVKDAAKVNDQLTGDAANELSIIEFAVLAGRTVPANKLEELRALHAKNSESTTAMANWETGKLAGTYEGKQWYYHADRTNLVDDQTKVNGALPAGSISIRTFAHANQVRYPENLVQQSLMLSASQAGAGANGAGANGTAGTEGAGKATAETGTALGSSAPALPEWKEGELAGILNGEEWFYSIDKRFVVNNKDLVNQKLAEGQAGVMSIIAFANALEKSLPQNIRGEFQLTAGSSQNDLVKAAAIALPAVLLIGGIAWYLNQDGRTYVLDASRTSSVPTEKERQDSEFMLSSNRAEVEAQIDASTKALNRGITAETGSNDFGKGLIALLVASILGAAAFAFGRRQLV